MNRYTSPTGDETDQTSFQYHLYTYYIKVALDAGATPILCTPIVRRDINGNYAGSSGHVTNGGDYAQAIIDLGAKYNVTVINLRDLTKELYSSLSNEQTAKMHATSGAVETVIDNTHLNSYGAAHVAYMLCKQLATTSNGLAAYVDQSKLVAPVYEKVIVKNQIDQPEDGDVTVYGSWELTTYTNHGQGKHQGINLIYYCAGPMEGKVSGGVGYVKATDNAGNGTVKDGVIGTEKGYLEFIPETDGQITIPLKKATSKTLYINSINNETYAVTLVGSFAAGLEEQTGEGYTVTLQDDRFNLTLDVKYGYTYRVAIHGSKMCVYDCTWVPSQNGGGGSQDQEEVLEPTVDLTPTNTVVVMLDGDYTNADLSKLQLKAYNSDFYGLNYKLDQTLTIVDYVAELVEGKTKVTFTVAEQVYGIYVADHNTVPTYDADKKASIINQAANAVTWQLDNGGWDKDYTTHISRAWNGTESKITKGWTANGKDLGTIDNDGTYSEMRLIAEAYLLTADSTQKQTFLASFTKAMAFLQNLQYPTGGFAQVYPRRGQYSDNVTFNDNAMVNVLKLLQDMSLSRYPFGEDSIADTATKELATTMVSKGVEYILQSQIVVNGKKTGWCAQHHPSTYAPVKARVYEHISISGSESVEIIKFLLTQVDNAKAQTAAKAAIAYLDSVKLENTTYDNQTAPYIYEKQGETVWYRFYEIGTNKGIFSDMSGEIKYDITQISEERRTGYNWCVDTPKKLLRVYNEVGYYANKVVVVASAEITGNGCSITSGSVINVETPFVAE
ncbi:MAG: pectate lyase [Clostridia bacterium]|nr:pectate lyase [Clostridia bacterium]